MRGKRVAIAGAGVFGAAAAVELARRGARVTLIDPGPLPRSHPLAESTDISKAVRAEYGDDEAYAMAVEFLPILVRVDAAWLRQRSDHVRVSVRFAGLLLPEQWIRGWELRDFDGAHAGGHTRGGHTRGCDDIDQPLGTRLSR